MTHFKPSSRTIAAIICIIAIAGFVGIQPGLAADKKVEIMHGKLVGVEGTVEVKKIGTKEWIPAKDGMVISPGDAVSAGIDGKAKLAYENSATDIEPLSQFVIGRAVESENQYTTEIFLQVGKIKSDVDKLGGKSNKFVRV